MAAARGRDVWTTKEMASGTATASATLSRQIQLHGWAQLPTIPLTTLLTAMTGMCR